MNVSQNNVNLSSENVQGMRDKEKALIIEKKNIIEITEHILNEKVIE